MVKTFVVAGAATLLMSVVAAPTAMAATTWEMPDLVGMNLEDAQSLYTETVGLVMSAIAVGLLGSGAWVMSRLVKVQV